MKLFFAGLLTLLTFSSTLRAQGYPITVCVNISGPQPSGPIVLALTDDTGTISVTYYDTLSNVTLPTTYCFSPYLEMPDSNSSVAFVGGYVSVINCGPSFNVGYSMMVTAATTIQLNLQLCGGSPGCSVSITQSPASNLLTANASGTPPFYYSWDGGVTFSNNNTFLSSGPGNWCVTTADANGCNAYDCYNISNSLCEVLISVTPDSISPLLSAYSQFGTLSSFLWSTGDTTQFIYVSAPGTYCVTASDTSGCSDSACYTYSGPQPPNCGGYIVQNTSPSGAFTLVVIPDSSLVEQGILWNNGQSGPVIFPTSSGVYCATIYYTNGCNTTVCYNFQIGNNTSCSAFATVLADSLLPNNFLFYSFANGTPPFTYNWLFSDGYSSNLPNVSHAFYNSNGNDWGLLTITDSNNCVSYYTVPVPVSPSLCAIPFTVQANYQGGNPGEVFFSPLVNGVLPSSYLWDLGNGTISSLENPSATYTSPGYYYVCLTVEVQPNPLLPAICTGVYCQSIFINPSWWGNPPNGNNCSASFIAMGNPVGAGIVNLVNTSIGTNLVYAWTVGSQGSNNPYPLFTISQPGIYPVCLSILDTLNGCTDSYCDTITIDSLGYFSRNGMPGNISIVVHQSPMPNAINASLDSKDGAKTSMRIMPNPSNGLFTLRINSVGVQQSQLDLFAMSGQQIASRQIQLRSGDNRIELNNPDLPPGTYSLRLISESGVQSSLLVIQP